MKEASAEPWDPQLQGSEVRRSQQRRVVGVPGAGPVRWEERSRRVKPWEATEEVLSEDRRIACMITLRGHVRGDWIWQGGSFSERGCEGLKESGDKKGREKEDSEKKHCLLEIDCHWGAPGSQGKFPF